MGISSRKVESSRLVLFYQGLKGQASISVDDLKKTLLDTLETTIQNHFKSHMPELMLISIVSSLKLSETGMHALHLLDPLLNVLRIPSLDSHH